MLNSAKIRFMSAARFFSRMMGSLGVFVVWMNFI